MDSSSKKAAQKAGKNGVVDWTNLIVITTTFVLFAAAMVTKGVTHDLLLEAAVFLVSVKLILATYKINQMSVRINAKLERIEKSLSEKKVL